MYKFQLIDAQADIGLQNISGVCPTSPQFTQYVNEGIRRLLRRGDWFDTEWVISLCVSGSIIAWPRWVGAIRGLRFGRGRPGQLFNNNYSFVGPHHRHSAWHTDCVIEDAASGPTASEVSGTAGKYIRYYVVNNQDVGATIQIFGSAYGGQPLQEAVNGAMVNGQTITAGVPFGSTGGLVTRIDAVKRSPTSGMAYLYEYDPVANTLRDLAWYEPGDTNPRIRRSIIRNRPLNCSQPDANGICWANIEALIKLEFVPVANPRDYLMIDNFDAIKFMIQAIRAEEQGDEQMAEIKITKAIRELNFDLRDKNSDDQIPVRVQSVMGRRITNPV